MLDLNPASRDVSHLRHCSSGDEFEVSKAIAEDGLLPAIRPAASTTVVVADGFSSREQIHQLGHTQVLHFAEVLARHCGCGG